MSKTNIRFTIFNEDFWGNGLIYTQNLLPLIKLLENNVDFYNIEIHSFTSILDLILYRKQIKNFKKEFKVLGIKTIIYPTFFVRSRIFILRWYVFPFYIFSTYFYLVYLILNDFIFPKKNIIYHLRSYPIAFLFSYFYKGKAKLIFDPRSDFNHENKKINFWKENSLTDKLWYKIEKKILIKSSKVIFISESFRDDLLLRHKIVQNDKKHFLFYNPIDFKKFEIAFDTVRNMNEIKFLYTGSLNNWNNLETYLDFFLNIKVLMPLSTFFIATNSRSNSFQHILDKEKYKEIIKDITFFYGLKYNQLPELYKECSIGLQLMDDPDSRIGVKFVEYLASGLIPLVNTNVRGAAKFCEKGLGIIVDNSVKSNYDAICDKILFSLKENTLNGKHKSIVLANKNLFDVNYSYSILVNVYKN